jgi:hypothetical protein
MEQPDEVLRIATARIANPYFHFQVAGQTICRELLHVIHHKLVADSVREGVHAVLARPAELTT